MSPSQPQGTQVSGNENDEFLSFVKQTIADETRAQLAAQNPGVTPQIPQQPQVPQQAPINVQLNGQNFQFTSEAELNRALQNTIQAYNTQINELKGTAQNPRGAEVSGQDEPKFDINAFVDKMGKDPIDAFDYIDQARYGVSNPRQAIKEALQAKNDVDEVKRVLAVYQFKDAHPEFEGNQQVASTLYNIMQQAGMPLTAQNLESAYALGIMKGFIPNPQFNQYAQQNPYLNQPPQFQQPQYQPQYPQYQQQAPLPTAPRFSADPVPDIASLAEEMSTDQIEAVFRRLQQ